MTKMEMTDKICPVCGLPENYKRPNGNKMNFMDPNQLSDCQERTIMIERGCCFTCAFWFDKIDSFGKGKKNIWCRINGESYHVHPFVENVQENKWGMGFGGREMYIEMNDGRLLKSNNVWHQGDIPENFKEQLSDNAKFIPKELFEVKTGLKPRLSSYTTTSNWMVKNLKTGKRMMIKKGQMVIRYNSAHDLWGTIDGRLFSHWGFMLFSENRVITLHTFFGQEVKSYKV